MAATLTVPTVFKAVDKFSTVVKNMAKNLGSFTQKAGTNFQRFNQKFNSFFKLGDLQKQLLSFAGTAALAGAIVSGIVFSGKSLIDYEKNVAAVHGILNQLSDKDFKKFNNEIDKVAKQTQYSSVEVAASFQKIAELNIDLAKTPESLGATARAAITLSRASGMELTPATESLVAIMAQFHLQGTDANRVINTLAAGLKYGSATIQDQADAFKNWGTVAQTANLSIEQAVALTQVLGKYQLKGEEAGTALRGTIIRLQKAHLGYASGLFNVNDALNEANKHYSKLARARDKDNYLIKLFGIRQIIAGRLLLQNIDRIKELTASVTNTNQANEQAAIKTDTVAGAWQRLTASFVNYITGNDKAKAGLTQVKNILRFMADNMDMIIDRTISIIKWFTIFKVGIWAVSAAIKLFNLYQVATAAVTATATAATAAQTVTVGGFGAMLSGVTAELGAANIAATGFFATLSSFAIPIALTGFLGGLAIWKVWDANQKTQKYGDSMLAGTQTKFDRNKSSTFMDPFGNQKEEGAYQKWWLQGFTKNPKDTSLNRSSFDKLFGKQYPSILDNMDLSFLHPKQPLPALLPLGGHGAAGDNNRLHGEAHVYLHIPGATDSKVDNSIPGLKITISSTTGPQGKK